jgi:molybdopterin synthase sulfur carrier subunit
MARLRLFANLREVAGTGSAEFPGSTVAEVLEAASSAYGTEFTQNLTIAKVWVNGDPAKPDDPVGVSDEIALIPPVSGGAIAAGVSNTSGALLVIALLVSLVIANNVGTRTFVFVVVGSALAWLWDITDVLRLRGLAINPIPLMVGATAAANGAYSWGVAGFAGGVAVAVVVVLDSSQRTVRSVAIPLVVGLVISLVAGALVLTHLRSLPMVFAALAIAASAGFAAWGVQQSGGELGGLDPNLGMVLGAVIAGLISALAADTLEITTMLLASAAGAAGLIAGRAFGSLLRTGSVIHTARAPGLLTMFDAAVLGVPAFWAAVWIFG